MSVKTDLHDYLLSIGQGTDISLGGFPDSPDMVVALEQYEGLPPLFTQDNSGIAYERPSIQARVRGDDTAAVEARAKQLFRLLNLVNVVLNGVKYQRVFPITSPMYMGLDENGRHHWSVNFAIHKEVEP